MTRHRKIWLTTDTHFNHPKLILEGHRPSDYEGRIVSQWNDVVGDQDIVIHLGDLIMKRPSELERIMGLLRGTKILVKGNHDNESIHWYMQRGFNFACDGIKIDDVWLSHEPCQDLPDGCYVNIHGHLHGDDHRSPDYQLQEWHCLLSLEKTGYKLVDLHAFAEDHRRHMARKKPCGCMVFESCSTCTPLSSRV